MKPLALLILIHGSLALLLNSRSLLAIDSVQTSLMVLAARRRA